MFSVDEARDAERELDRCIDALNDYADHVYSAAYSSIHETAG